MGNSEVVVYNIRLQIFPIGSQAYGPVGQRLMFLN